MDDSGATPGAPGQRAGTDLAAALGALSQAVSHEGGYDNIVGKLRAAGFDVQVDSWVSTGANEPIGPQQVGQAIGPGMVQRCRRARRSTSRRCCRYSRHSCPGWSTC